MKQILIIQTAFIGDVILATALIEKLHGFYPDASIDFLVREGNESLLSNHPWLREVLIWEKKKNKIRNLLRLLTQIRNRKYDLVVNVQRFAATGMLTALSGAKRTIGFHKNPWSRWFTDRVTHRISTADQPLHEIQRNQQLIAAVTDTIPMKPRMYPTSADFQKVKTYQSGPYICIAPASVWMTKQYPATRWASFLNQTDPGLKVFIIGAPNDAELAENIRLIVTNQNQLVNLCGKLSFLESAALMQGAMMNYVNDSAPMHLASATNAPVAAIYCSTIPAFGFGPLSDQSHIIEVQEKLDCRPCGLHGHKACPLGHFHCALHIKDEQLLMVLPVIS